MFKTGPPFLISSLRTLSLPGAFNIVILLHQALLHIIFEVCLGTVYLIDLLYTLMQEKEQSSHDT